jgi:hypothetical protein
METPKQRASRLYYESNKEAISEKRKEWYKKNRDTAIQRVKAYQEKKKTPQPPPSPTIKVDGPIKVSFE